MASFGLSQVSSNWKKLQEQLQAEKKAEPQSNGVKRKRSQEKQTAANGFKKARFSESNKSKLGPRKGKMGMGDSKPASNGHNADDRAKLVREHGIAASDISAAYGGSVPGTIRRQDDEVNGGLHPTYKVGKYVALDCEMVGIGPPPHTDNMLARVSLVNFHGEQIYDSFVLPQSEEEVKDYRTFVSGIKPSHLRPGYARPFAEVQKDVATLLEDRMLVGHALRNDLQVLILSHPKRDLRDTSRHPKFRVESKGKPPALRNLVKSELGMTIQTGEHSSVEDARAAMMLFKKEKVGFEEENRKHFGQHHRLDKKQAATQAVANGPAEDSDEEDEGEDDDSELLDGEDGEGAGGSGASAAQAGAKRKKRKKKKRTKRH